MEVEHNVKIFQLDGDLEANIHAMAAEGWLLIPGIVPVGVYHVVRIKGMVPQQDNSSKPLAQINVDDTKVKILRGGQLIDG